MFNKLINRIFEASQVNVWETLITNDTMGVVDNISFNKCITIALH